MLSSRAILTLLLALALGLAWPGPIGFSEAAKPPPPKPIDIGVFFPMTGAQAALGQAGYKALLLARKDRPSVLERPVRLLLSDTLSRPQRGAKLVEELITKDKVAAVIGGLTKAGVESGAMAAEAAGVPLVTPLPLDGAVETKRYLFWADFEPGLQAAAAARYARRKLGLKSAALLLDAEDPTSAELARIFVAEFEKSGGRIVHRSEYRTGRADFTELLDNLAVQMPDIIYCPGRLQEVALIARQARNQGLNRPILAAAAARSEELIRLAGPAAEGLIVTVPLDREGVRTVAGRRFIAALAKAHPGLPPLPVPALAYDAYNLLLDAIERAGAADPRSIAAALADTKGLAGVLGPITMIRNTAVKPIPILQVKDGRFVWIDSVEP